MARWPAFVAAAFAAALLLDLKAVYIAFYTFLLLHVAGGWMLRSAVERVEAHRLLPTTYLFPGETAEVRLRIENPSFMPITWLHVREHAPAEIGRHGGGGWVLSLAPRSGETLAYPVRGGRRGVYTLGPLELAAGDALGLRQHLHTLHVYHDVVVFPHIYTLDELGLPTNLAAGRERVRRPLHPDPARIAGVRPYEPGDPRRWIHWKATARARSLQVKQFEHTLSGEALLLVNLNSEDYPAATWVYESELAIATAASLAHRLAEARERFAFATNARLVRHRSAKAVERLPQEVESGEGGIVRVPPHGGRAQLVRVLEVLAGAACKPGVDFARVVSETTGDLPWGSAVYLVVPSVPQGLREKVMRLKAGGHRVLLFVTGTKGKELLEADVPGVRAYRVEHTAAGRLKLSEPAGR